MICCRVSRSFPLTRTKSPWIDACTFSLEFFTSFTISRAFSIGDALLQADLLAHGRAGCGLNGTVSKRLQRDSAFNQLALKHVGHSLSLYSSAEVSTSSFFGIQLDIRLRVLQVVAGMDLLQRLLHGVGDLLQIDLADYVE